MKSFPYPVTLDNLREFTDPDEFSEIHHLGLRDGKIHAANGFLALRAWKAAAIFQEVPSISRKAAERLERLPWSALEIALQDVGYWRDLDLVQGAIKRRGIIQPWTENAVRAPSPVWKIGGAFVLLSMLQLVARLPRASVYLKNTTATSPLFFKFSGGEGILAPLRKRPERPGFELFKPQFNALTGDEVGLRDLKPRTLPRSTKETRPNWPPPEPID